MRTPQKDLYSCAFRGDYRFPILTKDYAQHEISTFIVSGFLEDG